MVSVLWFSSSKTTVQNIREQFIFLLVSILPDMTWKKGSTHSALIPCWSEYKGQCSSLQIPPEKSWLTLIIRTPIFPLDMLVEDAKRTD